MNEDKQALCFLNPGDRIYVFQCFAAFGKIAAGANVNAVKKCVNTLSIVTRLLSRTAKRGEIGEQKGMVSDHGTAARFDDGM
jgi:hypothetical protein